MKNEKSTVAFVSVLAAIFLTAFKFIVGFSTGSLGILSEAAHSALDFVAAAITLFAVKLADKPPDKEHNFGHGKIENFSALIETLLLLLTCVWIIYEAVDRLFFKTVEIEVTYWSYIVVVVAIIIDIKRSKELSRVAKKYNSQALEADALHFKTDIWSSSVVLVGLVFAEFGFHQADSIAGLFVALIVIYISFKLGKRTIDALLDRVPEGLEDKVREKILGFSEIESIKALRIRQSGPRIFVNSTISFKRTLPFEKLHSLIDKIEQEIATVYNDIDIVIHPEPGKSQDESMLDQIKIISSEYGLSVHEYEMNKLADSTLSIDLHVESNPDLTLSEAHEIASKIEENILGLNEKISKVNIHIEELRELQEKPTDVTEESSVLIGELKKLVMEESLIADCYNFSVFRNEEKLKVLMDCKVKGELKVSEVHSLITEIENKIKKQFVVIDKINIHPEPV